MPKKKYTPLKSFILGVMNTIPKPMSGYELITLAKEWRYDHYIKASNASFYYTLKQLQEEGFIKEVGSKQEGNRPEQITYKLENSGRKEFITQVSYFLEQVQEFYFNIDSIAPFILLFGSKKGKEFIIKLIDKQIKAREEMYTHINDGEKFIKSHYLYDLSPFYILPLEHWKLHNEAEIKWFEYFKRMVDNIENFKENYDKAIKRTISLTQGEGN